MYVLLVGKRQYNLIETTGENSRPVGYLLTYLVSCANRIVYVRMGKVLRKGWRAAATIAATRDLLHPKLAGTVFVEKRPCRLLQSGRRTSMTVPD